MGNIVLQEDNIGIVRSIHNLDKHVLKMINKKLGELDISHVQGLIIIFLFNNMEKEIFQKDLEKEFGLSNPTVTASIKSMGTKSLVVKTKSNDDGRYYTLTLTEKANELAPKCSEIYENLEMLIRQKLNPQEILIFSEVISKIETIVNQ